MEIDVIILCRHAGTFILTKNPFGKCMEGGNAIKVDNAGVSIQSTPPISTVAGGLG